MKPSITVVSLGPGAPGLMTLETADALRAAKKLILRTGRHGCAAWLEENQIAYTTLDDYYDRFDDFDAMHTAMATDLWERASHGRITYAVMDASTDGSVSALYNTKPEEATLRCLAGLTATDECLAALPRSSTAPEGLRILSANTAAGCQADPRLGLMITELDSRMLAGEIKLWLSSLYPDELPVYFFTPSEKTSRKAVCMQLADLDRQKKYDHTVCVFIPPVPYEKRDRFCLDDLAAIIERLRADDGCPWDREQTHESLRASLIEEAYEAAGAIDEGDDDHLADELGDVLLQVVFHASIGHSHGMFDLQDVISNICRKMIRRHTHIFGTDSCQTAEDVNALWETNKKEEKGLKTQGEILADVSPALPALTRARKVQKKASKVGFDWDDALGALPKIHEEAEEVAENLRESQDPTMELGDLLFSCVNVARLAGADPEEALNRATEKFIRRFTAMEKAIISDRKSLEGLTLTEMDVYWDGAKKTDDEI